MRGLAGGTSTPLPELQTVCPGAETHQDLHRFSVEQPGQFWAALARARLTWDQDWHTDMDCSFHQGRFSWFSGGKLNVSVNCVDRSGQGNPFSAFHWCYQVGGRGAGAGGAGLGEGRAWSDRAGLTSNALYPACCALLSPVMLQVTYSQLLEQVCRLANCLAAAGVAK